MRLISHTAVLVFIGVAAAGFRWQGRNGYWTFVLLQSLTMAAFSLSVSNFGAMAMEPIANTKLNE